MVNKNNTLELEKLRSKLFQELFVVFKKAYLSEDQHIKLANFFGNASEIEALRQNRKNQPYWKTAKHPEISVIKGASPSASTNIWHYDHAWITPKFTITILSAKQINGRVASTEIINMGRILQQLPPHIIQKVQRATINHTAVFNFASTIYPIHNSTDPMLLQHPHLSMPILNFSPLNLPKVFTDKNQENVNIKNYILNVINSEKLPDYTHRWDEGDLLILLNTATIHRRKDENYNNNRLLHQTVSISRP